MNSLTAIKKFASIGDLSLLNTEVKESTVLAINENVDKITSLQNELESNKTELEFNIDSINEVL